MTTGRPAVLLRAVFLYSRLPQDQQDAVGLRLLKYPVLLRVRLYLNQSCFPVIAQEFDVGGG